VSKQSSFAEFHPNLAKIKAVDKKY